MVRSIEEGDQQQPRRRPEGYRQGPDHQHQEGRPPGQLPRELLQPAKGRQAPRDGVVKTTSQHVAPLFNDNLGVYEVQWMKGGRGVLCGPPANGVTADGL